jgi:prepilin-type N-terminal cleavage/methylation domain-containing protein
MLTYGVFSPISHIMRKRGFTLVELLIVVLILGALSLVAIPRVSMSAEASKTRACEANVDIINSQIELYKSINGSYPTIDALTANKDYFPEGMPVCPLNGKYLLNSQNRAYCTHSNSSNCGG